MVQDSLQHSFYAVVNFVVARKGDHDSARFPGDAVGVGQLDGDLLGTRFAIIGDQLRFFPQWPSVRVDIERYIVSPGSGQNAILEKVRENSDSVIGLWTPQTVDRPHLDVTLHA
jgi:hypothetical protein